MATQGLVSIVDVNDKVLVKAVCGCNGYQAGELAEAILKSGCKDVNGVYDLAKETGFGCTDCLVVYGQDEVSSSDGQLPSGYSEHLQDPFFNPRWDKGTADYTEIVTIGD